MKTRRIFGLLFAVVLALSFAVNASGRLWPAESLTGGVPDESLDEIDGTLLSEGDGAITYIDGFTYTHYLDATSGAAEDSPDVISPDANAGTKRWVLQKMVANGFDGRDGDIDNIGDIGLDSISSDDGTDIDIILGGDAGDDFDIDSGGLIYESDTRKTTIEDLIATTADINGGTADGLILGGSSAAAATVTSLSVSDGAITNVSDIGLDSISSDDGTSITITLGDDAGDDLIINGNTINVSGDTDNIGLAGAASADYFLYAQPSWTSTGSGTESAIYQLAGDLTGANGDTAYLTGTEFVSAITSQSNSETIAVISQVRIAEPNITIGTDTATIAASLYIAGEPTEGASNYGLYVDGSGRFDGDIHAGADDDIANVYIHDGGTLVFYDDSDDTSVTFGPVADGSTVLAITGSVSVSGSIDGTIGDIAPAIEYFTDIYSTGDINAGADDDIANVYIHDGGTLVFYDDSDDFSVTFGAVGDGTTVLAVTGSLDVSGSVAYIGVETEPIPVGYLIDGASAPDAIATFTSGTEKVDARTFAGDADEDLLFTWTAPADLDATTGIKFRVESWITAATGPSAETWQFEMQGCSLGDGDALDCTLGTAQTSNSGSRSDAQYDRVMSAWSSAMTSTHITDLAAGETIEFKLYRDVDDTDTYVQLLGVSAIELKYQRLNDTTF